MEINSNGWSKYEQFVLHKLDDIEEGLQRNQASNAEAHTKIYDKLSNQRNELTQLRTKLALWGMLLFALASTIGPAVAAYLIK